MNASYNDSPERGPDALRDATAPVDLDFELPVEPGYREQPPKGTWEAGYEMSLAMLRTVKDRPEFWAARDAQMVDVEFVM